MNTLSRILLAVVVVESAALVYVLGHRNPERHSPDPTHAGQTVEADSIASAVTLKFLDEDKLGSDELMAVRERLAKRAADERWAERWGVIVVIKATTPTWQILPIVNQLRNSDVKRIQLTQQ